MSASNTEKTLGIFTYSNMAKWLDRNVYKQNLNQSLSPTGDKKPALDQPGLKDMTLKAIDILEARSGEDGWFLMCVETGHNFYERQKLTPFDLGLKLRVSTR